MSYTDPQIGTLTLSGDPARFVWVWYRRMANFWVNICSQNVDYRSINN